MRRFLYLVAAAAVISIILVSVKERHERRLKQEMVAIESAVEGDDLELDLPSLDPESWIRQ